MKLRYAGAELRTLLTRCALFAVAVGGSAQAEIDLHLVPLPEDCTGRTLAVGLFAVSDDPNAAQSLSAMDVILAWDPQVLRLQGIATGGQYPYQWLFSGFPDDHNLDGLNNTWADGNALYSALAQLGGPPAFATPPPGLHVTSFVFRKLRVGTTTEVRMLPEYGQYSRTVVYDGNTPNVVVTGELHNAALVPSARGDMNCDGVVDFDDINPFVQALADPAGWQASHPGCPFSNCDVNCDGYVDFWDINPFVALLSQ
ncbi:MAG: hypothetical protein AB1716_13790 [Planctomycetota bacterium]